MGIISASGPENANYVFPGITVYFKPKLKISQGDKMRSQRRGKKYDCFFEVENIALKCELIKLFIKRLFTQRFYKCC